VFQKLMFCERAHLVHGSHQVHYFRHVAAFEAQGLACFRRRNAHSWSFLAGEDMPTKTQTGFLHSSVGTSNTLETKRVVDVPLLCRDCGNRDWRNFRYRAEGPYVEGKPSKLFGRCMKCGHSYLFAGGKWLAWKRS
jgi:hypothetical protein